MLNVELIYDADCPNVKGTREKLLRAFASAGLTPKWREWDKGSLESPPYVKGYGSPSILINGRDCAGMFPAEEAGSCRVYTNQNGETSGTPTVELITLALGEASRNYRESKKRRKAWFTNFAVLPGIGVALLPKLGCPACWPAYAGLLSAIGLGFLVEEKFLLALTAIFLGLSVGTLAFRARTRRGYGPFLLGVAAAALVLGGKFVLNLNLIMYAGVGVLVVASIWNSWPKRSARNGSCPSCVPAEPLTK